MNGRRFEGWAVCLALLILVAGSNCGSAGTTVQFRTVFGDLLVELYDQEKPITCNNFKALIRSGAYQNTFFHRVEPGFVAQGGGFASSAPLSTNLFGSPWYFLAPVPNLGSITNEFKVGPRLSNTNGTIAMAKTTNANSATSQFFFNLANNASSLDDTNNSGGFTVFGRVVLDTGSTNYGGVLGLFNRISYANGLVDMFSFPPVDGTSALFRTLPVTFFGGYYQPWYSELFYVDISLFSVRITTTSSQRQISWNSVYNRTNFVEYTTQFPPDWKTLVATNGNGNRFSVVDPTPTNSFRFYRVRVAK